jgi:indole-3-glycerol phosphate synthase
MLLEKIVRHKKGEVERAQKALPLGALIKKLDDIEPPRGFRRSLSNGQGIAVIAEIKCASPVRGLLCADFDPEKLSNAYELGGAGAISVLTDERYFKGRKEYIALVKKASRLPVLRKDFIIAGYQVFESRAIGADAVLLIVSILDDGALRRLLRLTASLGMDALVEVHNRTELNRAVEAGACIIGINNRNLKTFKVSLSTTLELAGAVPEEVLLVSESGISSREDILMLTAAGVKAVLIGETLVRAHDPCGKLKELLGRTEKRKA